MFLNNEIFFKSSLKQLFIFLKLQVIKVSPKLTPNCNNPELEP